MTDKNTDMNTKIYAIALTTLLMMGCDNDSDLTIKDPVEGFSVSQSEVTIYPAGGFVDVLLTSAASWEATYPDWIVINGEYNNTYGHAGSSVLQIKANKNKEGILRSGTIYLTSEERALSITVTQDNPRFKLTINDVEVENYTTFPVEQFDWYAPDYDESRPVELKIECNTWWKIRDMDEGASYFNFSQESGEGDIVLKISPKNINISDVNRTASFTLQGPIHSYPIKLDQDNRTFMLNKDSVSVNELGEVISGISINSEFNWNTSLNASTDDWSLNVDSGSGYNGYPVSTDLELTIWPNNSRDTIHHEVIFSPQNAQIAFNTILKVKQDPFIFDIDGSYEVTKTLENNPENGENLELKLNSSTDWSIKTESIPDWLDISQKSGKGEAGGLENIIVLSAKDQNLDFENNSRTATIIFKNKANDLGIEMGVEQNMYELSVENDYYVLKTIPEQEPTTDGAGFVTAELETSGDWEVSVTYPSSEEWLEFRKLQGTQNDDLKFKAKGINSSSTDRTCIITITSTLHKQNNINLSRKITVIQNKAILESYDAGTEYKFSAIPSADERRKISYESSFDIAIDTGGNDWIEILEHNTTEQTIIFSVKPNYNDISRSGSITIAPITDNTTEMPSIDPIIFNVEQEAYIFEVNDTQCNKAVDANGGDLSIYVDCSGTWEYIGADQYSWLSITKLTEKEMRVTVVKNTDKKERTATIIVRSKDKTSLEKKITISQKAK